MINVSKRNRGRYLQQTIGMMQNIERPAIRNLRPVINKQFKDAAALIEQGIFSIDYAVDNTADILDARLRTVYNRTASVFISHVVDSLVALKIGQKSIGFQIEYKSFMEEFWDEINFFTRTQVADKVTQITATTKFTIRKIIKKGINDKLSYKEIAANIKAKGKILSKSRAFTIARTEVHSAANNALHTAMVKTRLRKEKEWISAGDGRVRIDHALADGERVAENAMFEGTGEPMLYPGYPGGSAWNVINCRCAVIYHIVREEIQEMTKPINLQKPGRIKPAPRRKPILTRKNNFYKK